jgi:hypothetical protein
MVTVETTKDFGQEMDCRRQMPYSGKNDQSKTGKKAGSATPRSRDNRGRHASLHSNDS